MKIYCNYSRLIGSSLISLFVSDAPASAEIANNWAIADDVNITANNDNAAVLLKPEFGMLMESSSIGSGVTNSISASAVGASASASYSGATFLDASAAGTIDGDVSVVATNFDSTVTTNGAVEGSLISGGYDNAIKVSAVGVSAQFGVDDFVSGGSTFTRALDVNGEISIFAENSGAVTLQTDFDSPQISGGTRNTISGTAAGATAAISASATVHDGAYESEIAIGSDNAINVTAINSGDVTIGSTDDPTEPSTLNGATTTTDSVDGSISLMAIGASGSVSSSTVVYSGSTIPSVAFGDVNFDVQNSGTVQANVAISDISVEGKNSISTGAVGSTTTFSAKVTNYTPDNFSSYYYSSSISYSSVNTGSIFVYGGMSNPNIADGYNVTIAMTAIGSSSSHSIIN